MTDPQGALAELGRIRLSETSLDDVLLRVATLARDTVEGAGEASVTLVGVRSAGSAATTGDLAKTLDEWQYENQGGPCLEAAATTATVLVPDVARETRWPRYIHRAAEAGLASALSVGLPVQEAVTGALNLYSRRVDAFDDHAVTVVQSFAGYAAVALANAQSFDSTATLARQMREAMAHRATIEQAKGIIMAEQRCSPDEAFARLSKLSQHANRKLRDVAAALVEQASRPR
ncbi:transcriptional regulator [Paractinoplanes abujensis]|uniref:GAF domain-containing protein n=1 Tax=Paractinoplanes abujensis TaxID=882441 RepID=A0A7W7CT00_9ACTN|nr:GAF and ANTAR domain-containing protein [Actinoplanes abujensis]MBB4693799.1 GAF domain-containing protein [Actinoplanes abujensis]GID21545.1 transcriptional regulator [Actinoplanes abujensis]